MRTVPPPAPVSYAFVRPCSVCSTLVDTNEDEGAKCQGCEAWLRGEPRVGTYTDEVVAPRARTVPPRGE